ncbi:MAG TPA: metallophosphoesterase [Longimicrobium sp.]|nr:metallophosphoesterase [Longimicrobium sp.]
MRTIPLAAVLALASAGSVAVRAQAPRPSPVTLVAAGDIAVCHTQGDEQTAALVDSLGGEVLALGDNAYPSGSQRDYTRCYGPSWGRFRGRTHPTPGNHEYFTRGAGPYFAYYGAAAGPRGLGYYSFDLGAWHVVSLNSIQGTEPGSPQERWLRADLAAHPGRCTLAFWHHPRFSSGPHGSTARMAPLWRVLQDAGVDVVLSAHDHHYERFASMDADGRVDHRRGMRSFVVGTGGGELYEFVGHIPGSEAQYGGFGVLKLVLDADGYGWEFIAAGGRRMDHGHGQCR